jgi:hypothetical protein
VVNFPKKQIGNFMSECLIFGAVGRRVMILLAPDFKIQNRLQNWLAFHALNASYNLAILH